MIFHLNFLKIISGIVQLVKPIEGPTIETLLVHIHTKSRTNVVLAYNYAIIEVNVAPYFF